MKVQMRYLKTRTIAELAPSASNYYNNAAKSMREMKTIGEEQQMLSEELRHRGVSDPHSFDLFVDGSSPVFGVDIREFDTTGFCSLQPLVSLHKIADQECLFAGFPKRGSLSSTIGMRKIEPALDAYCEQHKLTKTWSATEETKDSIFSWLGIEKR